MNYRQALVALDARQETRIELGLDRVRERLRRLGDPQKRLRCFHVAGTNGKGSVCAMLEAALRAGGYKTGLYTSPHLSSVRERIKVRGKSISRNDFAHSLKTALNADPERKLTYFELLTIAAFDHFAAQSCDVVVLETGLGGRLDATNVIEKPLASIITSIGFDHMAFLGKTLTAIAREKAGIAKPGVPLLCPRLAPAALREIKRAARGAGAPLTVVERGWAVIKRDWPRGRQVLRSPLGPIELSLLGDRQGMNAALVLAALRAVSRDLPVDDAAFSRGLRRVTCRGRFEVRRLGAKTAILDGAHNAEAAAHLARTWRASPWAGRPAR